MRLGWRDTVAALVLLAVLFPYAGFLARGEVPGIDDVRTMATAFLMAGAAAIAIADGLTWTSLLGRAEIAFAVASAAMGIVTIVFAETPFGQMLLGGLVTGLLLTCGMQLLDHVASMGADRPPHRSR